MSKTKTSEIRLVAPRRVPLTGEQEREALSLLAELLLEAPGAPFWRRYRRRFGRRDRRRDPVPGEAPQGA